MSHLKFDRCKVVFSALNIVKNFVKIRGSRAAERGTVLTAHTHADAGKLLQEEQLEQLSATETEWARMKEMVFHVPASCDIVTSICDYEIVMDNSTPHAVNLDDNSSV